MDLPRTKGATMLIGTAALALIAFLVIWLVLGRPVIGLVVAVLILIFVSGGVSIGNR